MEEDASPEDSIVALSRSHSLVNKKAKFIENVDQIFDEKSFRIKQDILRLICHYLKEEGYTASFLTIQDEANIKLAEQAKQNQLFVAMKKAITDGDWPEVERLCSKNPLKNKSQFLFAARKQQYLELLESQEYQKAFTFLTKRLKPVEPFQTKEGEFEHLCYLLTCKSQIPADKDEREQLVKQFQSLLDLDNMETAKQHDVPHQRLVHMLKQAVAYQIEFSRYHPKSAPTIATLLDDYHCLVLPNTVHRMFTGHSDSVKAVEFVGLEGLHIVSGSSDNTVKIWDCETSALVSTLSGHISRIWDVTSNQSGTCIASASGDCTVKLWDAHKGALAQTLTGHSGDVYTCGFHPRETHVISGGYDKTLKLHDATTGQLVRTFQGHSYSVTEAIFNPHGNLVVSGSKDCTIRFWDISSGVCIKSISGHLGEVTSVHLNDAGTQLLSSAKDNSNRLWDVATARPLKKFKGHANTSKNFVRARFGSNCKVVIGGSEDGIIYIWDVDSGTVLQQLVGHSGIVFDAVWSPKQSLLASCSEDGTVRTWYYDGNM
mmetsp:Transcript_16887/g.43093  ORF Transcript_16887/g.43093 Transcript_16887/m.43093 type:complete len:544 (+) Transcript_16887:126-1757(+)|eukprot:CAMPEP_0177636136 /NCGR_PEP_ID=MMETSP0447-20121125/4275_1 /TAXON_ID=0 /ORGANISM="Stygamoeba regulata, Strain BSH-02190019" /LENGTH=543 /DNA_ID=CAMNT_0019137973 /DNA_START=90 /DNA_END=1721 /DNA_ORIENTATION=-